MLDHTTSGSSFLIYALLFIIALLLLFVFIIPQIKHNRKREIEINEIKNGDMIVTPGGISGKVVEVFEDSITIDTGDKELITISKSAIMLA